MNRVRQLSTFPLVATLLAVLDAILRLLRPALLVVAVLVAAIALLDWLVRTRRVSPFSAPARFARRTIDPLLSPLEARVVRHGGMPQHAPFWALAVVVVGGLVLIGLLSFLRQQLAFAGYTAGAGPRGILRLLVVWGIGFLQIALIVRVISSWVRVSPYSRWIHWAFRTTDWLVEPLRRVLPPFGFIDISPLVAYLVLWVVRALLLSFI